MTLSRFMFKLRENAARSISGKFIFSDETSDEEREKAETLTC